MEIFMSIYNYTNAIMSLLSNKFYKLISQKNVIYESFHYIISCVTY